MVNRKDTPNVAKNYFTVMTKKQRIASPLEAEFEGIPGSMSSDKSTSIKCKHCSMVLILDSPDITLELKRHLDVCAVYALVETKSREQIAKVYEELRTIAFVRHGVSLSLPGHGDIGDIKPASTKTSTELCLEMYKKEKEKLKHVFEGIPSRVCVTCDIFNDASNREYLCLSANYVDHNWKLNSKLLNLVQVPPTNYALILATKVDNLLEEWGITNKISTITLSNKKCCNTMQDKLRKYLSGYYLAKRKGALPCEGEFLYVHCSSSFLDNIAQEAFKTIEDLIFKIREGVKQVLLCKYRLEEFVRVAGYSFSKCDCSEGLWLDCPSRWVSTYRMMERILRCQEPFERAIMVMGLNGVEYLKDEGIFLKTVEWSRVENICKLVRPLYDMASLFMGTEYPTANSFFVYIWETGMCLSEALKNKDPDFRNMAERLKCKFDEYWECYNAMLASPIIFDPRYKLRFAKFCYHKLDEATADKRCVSIRSRLQKIFLAYASKKHALSDTKQTSPVLQRFEEWKIEEQLYSINSQLDIYLTEPTIDPGVQLDVLSWWKQNENRFPELALLAIDILSIPIATFSSDSAFNLGTRLSHKWRSAVLPENPEAQLVTRNWLYGYQVDASNLRGLVGVQVPILKSKEQKK